MIVGAVQKAGGWQTHDLSCRDRKCILNAAKVILLNSAIFLSVQQDNIQTNYTHFADNITTPTHQCKHSFFFFAADE